MQASQQAAQAMPAAAPIQITDSSINPMIQALAESVSSVAKSVSDGHPGFLDAPPGGVVPCIPGRVPAAQKAGAPTLGRLPPRRDCPPGVIEFFPSPNPLFSIAPRTGCLRLELGTCLGPCTADVTSTTYHQQMRAGSQTTEPEAALPFDAG